MEAVGEALHRVGEDPEFGMVDRLLARATKVSSGRAWALLLLSVLLTGFFDWLSGDRLWFGPFYLLSICAGTWILGAMPGALIGFSCFGMGLLMNGASVYPYGPVELVWNASARISAVAGVVVLVAAFRRSHDREARNARTDKLTGALTRQGLLERAWSLPRVNKTAVLAYLDLDSFKAVNDRHGHAAGDEILRMLSRRIAGQLRAGDLFARLGGDEFLVYLSADSRREACDALASLHARLNTSIRGNGHHVGCSIGAVILEPGQAIDEAAISAADRLMYLAKKDGRGVRIGVHHPTCEISQVSLGSVDPVADDWHPSGHASTRQMDRPLAKGVPKPVEGPHRARTL